MRLRERKINREVQAEQLPPVPPVPGVNLDRSREAAERFFAAGDEAINRALSSSSENFLAANRQEGGE